jgi:hypothetical protein
MLLVLTNSKDTKIPLKSTDISKVEAGFVSHKTPP